MTKLDKLIQKILCSKKEARFKELEKVLIKMGYEKVAGKGSHMKFLHKQYDPIVIPFGVKIKKVYVEQVRAMLVKYFENSPEIKDQKDGNHHD